MPIPFDPFEGWEDEPTGRFGLDRQARVLVAEDDAHLRAMMAHRLRNDGCDVTEAASGLDTLDRLDEDDAEGRRFDLIVMDVRMPGMTGLEVAYLIRTWQWAMPIVLVTAYPEPELYEEATRLHARLLAKPFPFAKLSEAALAAVHE
jgi:CheY-like chemotaxis protein